MYIWIVADNADYVVKYEFIMISSHCDFCGRFVSSRLVLSQDGRSLYSCDGCLSFVVKMLILGSLL